MYKIYSRPRITIFNKINYYKRKIQDIKNKKKFQIIIILIIAFSTAKLILDSILPIFDTLCENKAKSIATIISNEQATAVMKRYTYDDMFIIEKDSDN